MRPLLLVLLASFPACHDEGRAPRDAAPAEDGTVDLADLEQDARAVLLTHIDPARFGPTDAYEVLRLFEDRRGIGHVVFQQVVDGVPVFGGEIGVHLHADGAVRALVDELRPDLRLGDPATALGAAEAKALAGGLASDPEPELWAVRHDDVDHLAWVVQLSRMEQDPPTEPRVFLDAVTGGEFWRYENLRTVPSATETEYDGVRDIEAVYEAYYDLDVLEDPDRDFLTGDFFSTSTDLYYVTTDPGETFPDPALGSIHFGTQSTLDYYADNHGRNGIDGLGGPGVAASIESGLPVLTAGGHFSVAYNNASWSTTSRYARFGDGDGVLFSPLVSLDVVAHEYAHGVTQYEANLVYANESGALNESMSDVFGAAVERSVLGESADTWRIGEDCFTPGTVGDALRYMDDPTADGSSREHYTTRYTGAQDGGGVHWNSGIGNLAFVLAADGGLHPNPLYNGAPIPGIGFDAAAGVWYDALALYALSSTPYHGFRTATILAAEDAYGADSPEVQTIDAAWDRVGVTPWVLLPGGYAASGVGSPSVEVRGSNERVMAFETRIAAPDATCPNGRWGIGFATASSTAREFTRVGGAPLIAPSGIANDWRACVVAHPSIVVDTGGAMHVWFKAETDSSVCGDDAECLYRGIGYARVNSALTSVLTAPTRVISTTDRVLGYPSVTQVGSTWYMTLQQYPDIYRATSTAAGSGWVLSPTPVMTPGLTTWAVDEVFNAALVCEDSAAVPNLTAWFGGRDTSFEVVMDGGVGTATSNDATTWSAAPSTLYAFDGNERWRHWSVLRHGAGIDIYYDEKVGGVNRIGLRSTLTSWTASGMSDRKCPP